MYGKILSLNLDEFLDVSFDLKIIISLFLETKILTIKTRKTGKTRKTNF